MIRLDMQVSIVGAFFLALPVFADVPVFPVVGNYEDSAMSNRVDASAAFYAGNSSGSGDDASLVVSFEDFNAAICKAFEASCGGIVNFDNNVITGGTQTAQFKAGFGEGKYLMVQSIDHLRTDFSAPAICVPISGPGAEPSGGFLAKSNVGGDQIQRQSNFEFTFEEEGFAKDEHVRAVGGTILGRNGSPDNAKWLMKASLDNGDMVSEIAEIDFRSGNSRSDTFFGIKAPKGRYITAVSWVNLSGTYSGLDGFAFITNGAPPKRAKPTNKSNGDLFGFNSPGSSRRGGGSSEGGEVTLFGRSQP